MRRVAVLPLDNLENDCRLGFGHGVPTHIPRRKLVLPHVIFVDKPAGWLLTPACSPSARWLRRRRARDHQHEWSSPPAPATQLLWDERCCSVVLEYLLRERSYLGGCRPGHSCG